MTTLIEPIQLTPIQRFLHRLVEGAPLEDKKKTIRVLSNAESCLISDFEPEVEYLTEAEFYSKLISEGRLKLSGPPGNAHHLMWAKGRRSGATVFARHWNRTHGEPNGSVIVTCNTGTAKLIDEPGVNTFSAATALNGLRGPVLKAASFDEASHFPSGSKVDSLIPLALPNRGVRMFVTGTPSGDGAFERLFFRGEKGFWRVRTATWEGTDVPLEEIFRHAPTSPNFMREFGFGW